MAIAERLARLRMRFGDDAAKIVIIQIGFFLHPILETYGLGQSCPVAVEIENQATREILLREIRLLNDVSVTALGISRKDLIAHFETCEGEVFPVICHDDSAKSREALFQLQALFAQKGNRPVPLIFFQKIPPCMRGALAGRIIFHQESIRPERVKKDELEQYIRWIVNLICDNFSCVHQLLSQLHISGKNGGKEFLVATEKICEFMLEYEESGCVDKDLAKQTLQNGLVKMMDEWDLQGADIELLDMVRDCIFRYIPKISGALDRKQIDDEQLEKIEECLLVDTKYYYFTLKQLEEICGPMKNFVSIMQIKELLADGDVLVGEGRNRSYLTVKVPVFTSEGMIDTGRRIRLRRTWLDIPGELTLQEKIEEAGGKEHDQIGKDERIQRFYAGLGISRKPAHIDSGTVRRRKDNSHEASGRKSRQGRGPGFSPEF